VRAFGEPLNVDFANSLYIFFRPNSGASCEFRANEIPECTLECDNGGMCQLGLHVPFNDLDHLYLTNTSNPEDFMHCVCPEGYGGKTCSIPTDQCGEFHCYHGGTCLSRIDDSK
jgi:hypothetical protein